MILKTVDLAQAKIDIGTLALEWKEEAAPGQTLEDFIHSRLMANSHERTALQPKDVVLYGFGRIGRLVAALLSSDSVHGDFGGSVYINDDGSEMVINGNRVKLIYASRPEEIDYTEYGIKDALIIDNTGVFRDKEALATHLRPGASQVMLTAPGKKIPNIVFGVNHEDLDPDKEQIMCEDMLKLFILIPVIRIYLIIFIKNQGEVGQQPSIW